MQRLFLLVAVMLLSGCLTAPPKEAARPTLMPRAQSYKDLTHLPAPTGKIFVSVYNIQDETGQFKPYPASNFSTAVPQSATAMLVTALKDSRWFIPLERQGLQNLLNERKIIRAAYSAAIFLIPICISFDTAEKRRYATYLILNRRFSFGF